MGFTVFSSNKGKYNDCVSGVFAPEAQNLN